MSNDIDPAIAPMIQFYACSIYPVFEQIGYDQSLEAAQACSEFSLEYPLLMRETKGKNKNKFPKRYIPYFGECTGPYCVALLSAFLVWSQHLTQGDHVELPGSAMLEAAQDGWDLYKMGMAR